MILFVTRAWYKNNIPFLTENGSMKLVFLAATLVLFATAGCKPSTPDSPDPASYGKVITPDHHVPVEHQDTQEKS